MHRPCSLAQCGRGSSKKSNPNSGAKSQTCQTTERRKSSRTGNCGSLKKTTRTEKRIRSSRAYLSFRQQKVILGSIRTSVSNCRLTPRTRLSGVWSAFKRIQAREMCAIYGG
eukprot:6206396-Pleurochrysis_carterae.AAC.1